jgi:hypothetical protein
MEINAKMKNTNIKKSLLAASLLSVLLLTGESASAIWGERKIYKISDITQQDADGFCRGRYGNYTSARLNRPNDTVDCSTRSSNGEVGGSVGYPNIVSVDVTHRGVSWNTHSHHLTQVCDYKHPGYGTWVGDGGHSCYDSYRQ